MVKVSSEGKGVIIEEVDGTFHLSENLNDQSDLSPLAKANPPLSINLKELKTINSIGSRTWFKFLDLWGNHELRIYACPPCLISLFNLAPKRWASRVKRPMSRA